MLFLGLVSDWLSKAGDMVEGTMIKAVRTLFYALDTFIYRLIIDLYDVFETLCSSRLLSSDILKTLSDRIGLILGLIMLFYVVFGFVQMLLDPDKITAKDNGAISIVKKIIIVIVMLGISNFVFDTLYSIQSSIVQSHVISRLLLPYSIEVTVGNETTEETKSVMDNKRFGSILSEELLHTFYQLEDIEENVEMTTSDAATYSNCESVLNSFRLQIVNYKRFDLGYNCLNDSIKVKYKIEEEGANVTYSDEEEINVIYFNWLFSLVCGVAVAYLMFMYCFKVGIRMVQLMFLEVISPMAFVSYLSPKKDSMFSKWSKVYVSTYIDVFIRIAIINFVFFLIAALFSNNSVAGFDFWNNTNITATTYTKSFYTVIIILSLLSFAHRAPDLLKDLLGSSASKLGFGASMKDIVGLRRGIGTIAGATTGAAVGFLGGKGIGAIGGVLRGAHAGFGAKGIGASFGAARKAQSEHNLAVRNGQLPGIMDRISMAVGGETYKDEYDSQISKLEESIENEKVNTASIRRQSTSLTNAAGYEKQMMDHAENKLLNDHFDSNDIRAKMQENLLKQQAAIKIAERSGDAEAIANAQMAYNTLLDDSKQRYVSLGLAGSEHGGFDDNALNAVYEDFANELRINADGAFDGINFDVANKQFINSDGIVISGYSAIKEFKNAAKDKNASIAREISVSDAHIKGIENQIQSIKNTQGYRDSHKIK